MPILVPANQRRTLAELRNRLDLGDGDRPAKRSAYWIMLILAGAIAISGIVGDSTATVIGAMIIAPLATPILGIGLGVATGRLALVVRGLLYVAASIAVVVGLGFLVVQLLPDPTSVLSNSQVVGRTFPRLMDLLAAIATGLAGAIAIARRDVGDVLPGVAIAISLIPPLGVIGVCLGSGATRLALGALVLFLSNVVALVIVSIVVFIVAGYSSEETASPVAWRRRAYAVVAAACVLVAIPIVANSLTTLWTGQVREVAEEWVGNIPGAEVERVTWHADDVVVEIRSPAELPDLAELKDAIQDLVPWEPEVVVLYTRGERIGAGGG